MLMNSILKILVFLIMIFLLSPLVQAAQTKISMPSLARKVVEHYLSQTKFDVKAYSIKNPVNERILGVFVTIFDFKKTTKGCWGNLYPGEDLKKSVEIAAIGAVKSDYRKKPIALNQLKYTKFQVTIVKDIIQVSSYREISPVSNGMMLKSGSKTGIILPGEAVDSYYQMIMCRLKAGIDEHEQYQIYKLITNKYIE